MNIVLKSVFSFIYMYVFNVKKEFLYNVFDVIWLNIGSSGLTFFVFYELLKIKILYLI
ncbi:hypothetical protein FHR29_004125 [Sphingobacterium sp. JUb56]|nr:hypothetical protein [Sphingobacterium sp. JUb56]